MQELRRRAARVARGDAARWVRSASHRALPAPASGEAWSARSLRPRRARALAEVDLHALRAAALEQVLGALGDVPVLVLPAQPRFPRRLAVRESDLPRIDAALAQLPPTWERTGGGRRITLRERLVAAPDHDLHAPPDLGVELHVLRREGEDLVGADRAGPARLDADAFAELAAQSLRHVPDAALGRIGPIDAVVTWVDGDDPAWQQRRDAALRREGAGHPSGRGAARFRTVDELRACLRSLHCFAGWIRTIHLVTDAQRPAWLDADHPRIRLVDHRELLGGSRFNSHAIESALHRIPGLAEHYLYLNDDVLLGRIAYPEDFFAAPGVARFFPSDLPIDPGPASERDQPLMAAAKNGRDLMARRFGLEVTSRLRHTVHPQLRSIGEQIERENPEQVAATRAAPFRRPTDLSVAASLHHWYALAQGRAAAAPARYLYVDLADPRLGQTLDALASLRRYDSFCLNQEQRPAGERARAEVRRFLESYLPTPAPWEVR